MDFKDDGLQSGVHTRQTTGKKEDILYVRLIDK